MSFDLPDGKAVVIEYHGVSWKLRDGICLKIKGDDISVIESICSIVLECKEKIPAVKSLMIQDATFNKQALKNLILLITLPLSKVQLERVKLSHVHLPQKTDYSRLVVRMNHRRYCEN